MLRLLSVALALMSLLPAAAQQVRGLECGFGEYRPLLSAAGFEAYAFDVRDFLKGDGRRDVTLRVREYADGRQIDSTDYLLGANKELLTDYPEEQRAEIAADGEGVVMRAERLLLGCYPSRIDSLSTWLVELQGMSQFYPCLPLRNVAVDATPRYYYLSRPFEQVERVVPGEFVPLVFFGSMWHDRQYGIYRFCGEEQIAPDLSSEIVNRVPHFYVLGVVFTPTEEE